MRQKDLVEAGITVGALITLAGAALVVLRAIDTVWANAGLIYELTQSFATVVSGNLDIPVVFLIGIMLGWLLLFTVDGTKRVQGILVAGLTFVTVGQYLRQSDRVLGAIGRQPVFFGGGLLIGLTTGIATAELFGVKRLGRVGLIETLAWMQFPTAAEAFRHTVTILVVLTIADVGLTVSPSRAITVAIAGVVLLISLSLFMQYDYQRRVMALSPPDSNKNRKYFPYVLGGLFHEAKRNYHGFTIAGGGELQEASVDNSFKTLRSSFNRPVSFGFASGIHSSRQSGLKRLGGKLLPRTVTITSESVTTNELPSFSRRNSTHQATVYGKMVVRRLKRHFVLLVPKIIRERLPAGGLRMIDRLDQADVVLLIGPTLRDDEPTPPGRRQFQAVAERYSSDPTTEVLLVTTEAENIIQQEDIDIGPEMAIKARNRLRLNSEHFDSSHVFPLTRFTDQGMRGFSPLLDRLSE